MTEPVAPITDAELASVVEAVGRMTPGPWIPQQLPNGQWFVAGFPLPPHLAFNTDILGEDDYDTKEDDAKAISLLRNHFAAIIARLNEERARRKRAEALLLLNQDNCGCCEDNKPCGNCRRTEAHLARTAPPEAAS